MITEHEHIVFCDEHYNSLGLVRSLGEYGIKPIVVVIKSDIVLTSKSKYISQCFYVDTMEEGFNFILNEFGNRTNKPFIYTCDDTKTSFLDEHYDELKDRFYFFNAGSCGRVNQYMDKENICLLAKKHGLKILDTLSVEKGVIPENLEYPVITKAINSKAHDWKSDMHICRNEEELKQAYQSISSSTVLIQKYIKKKNEYCLDGLCVNNGREMIMTIASTYNYLLPDSYSPYMTITNFDRPDLKKKLENMFAEVGFNGICSVEFLVDENDDLYFMEINFRNSTWSYASTCLGMNLPILWAKGMLNKQLEPHCTKKIKDGYTAVVEPTDLKCRMSGHNGGIIRWIRDVATSNCRYYIGRKDWKPVRAFICSRFKLRKKGL